MTVASLELSKELRRCSLSSCNKPHEARGYCSMHYKRFMRTGDPLHAYPNKVKHGMNKTKIWNAWSSMRDRCINPNSPVYKHYGGRGITIYEAWFDFDQFRNDVGLPPTPQHSLERIDNDKGYYPDNVIWADKKAQSNNTRRNKFLTLENKTQTVAQWAEELKINYNTLYGRVNRGWSMERALSCTLHR